MSEFDRDPWVGDARRLLDDSARGLDAAALSRLNRARQAALAAPRRVLRAGWFAAAGVAATALLLLAVAVQSPPRSRTPSATPVAASGAPAATAPSGATPAPAAAEANGADDSDEFFQDLDFYAWLDAQEGDGDG